MTKNILTVGLLIICIGLCGCAPKLTKPPTKFTRYYNQSEGFSIELPKGWETKENVRSASIMALSPSEKISGGRLVVSITVNTPELTEGKTLDEYYQLYLERINMFSILDQGQITIDDVAANWHTFSYKNSMNLQYLLVKNGKAYIIAFVITDPDKFSESTASFQKTFQKMAQNKFSEFEASFQKMAQSFKCE